MSTLDYRLGIDVGGTNADAVILHCSDQLRAKIKVPTTADANRTMISTPSDHAATTGAAGRERRPAVPAGTGACPAC